MIGVISLIRIAAARRLAWFAERIPDRRELIETCAAALLLVALALIGSALPLIP